MKTIRAYRCIRERAPSQGARSVCILLDEEHAKHTLRAFLRGQGSDAVVVPISDVELATLLAGPGAGQTGTIGPRKAHV